MIKRDASLERRFWPGICLGLSLILFAPSVVALGLGEIRVTSKLGEHFIGRIPLFASPGESIDASCFKLLIESPNKQDGIPFMDSARLTVNSGNGAPYLRVSSRKRISDLIVRLVIKSGCESETTREYTILLDLPDGEPTRPEQVVVNEPLTASVPPSKSISPASPRAQHPIGPEWEVVAGDSLTSIAASFYPNSQRMQRKLIRHAVAANPDLLVGTDPGALLPEGTLLRFPDLREPARKSVKKEAAQPMAAETIKPSEKAPDIPPVSRKSAKVKKSGAEVDVRLKLTTGDLDVSASGKITEGEREILREKQRILMDIDDMAAYNLSLNHRLKDMESHIQELHAKLDAMEHQRSELAATRSAAPAHMTGTPPEPRKTAWEWPAYTNIMLFSAGALGLLAVLYLMWKRKRAEVDALMELDVDLGSTWEVVPEAKRSEPTVSPPGSVNADAQPGRVVEPEPAQVIDSPPALPAAFNKAHSIAEAIAEVTLGSIECAIEEADIYIALGEGGRAISNLKYRIDSEPKSTADLWLKLLEIYHDLDMRSEFETLADEFHQHFNIEKPTWEKMAFGGASSGSIEQFPHLLEKISSSWGSPACLEYLNHLLLDNKGGLREGFELGIAGDILLLIRILEMLEKFDGLTDDGTHSDEKMGALEFVFESGVSEEHNDNVISSRNVEVSPEPVVDAFPPLAFELAPQTAEAHIEVPFLTESNSEIALPRHIDPKARADHWRELLETYRDADLRDEFELFAQELSLNFNIATPSWDEVTATAKNTLSIEHFPSLAREITALWGAVECRAYLRQLLFDVRDGKRKGFDLGVSKEILLLLFILERELNGDLVPERAYGQSILSEAVKPEFSLELPDADGETEEPDLGLLTLDFDKIQTVEETPVQSAEPARNGSIDTRSALEKLHRRIVESLTLIWGEPEAAGYLESLIADERGGRAGFDKEVMAELMMLSSLAGPVEVANAGVADIWGVSGEKDLAAQNALKFKKN